MTHIENVFIDEFHFDTPIKPDYKEVMGMFSSSHDQDCCEDHWLDFDASEEPFKEVTRRLEYINHIEIKGTPWMGITIFFGQKEWDYENRVGVFVGWYNSNNGYYSSELTLHVQLPDWTNKTYDIGDYQEPTEY